MDEHLSLFAIAFYIINASIFQQLPMPDKNIVAYYASP
jgi:hypothetical protein